MPDNVPHCAYIRPKSACADTCGPEPSWYTLVKTYYQKHGLGEEHVTAYFNRVTEQMEERTERARDIVELAFKSLEQAQRFIDVHGVADIKTAERVAAMKAEALMLLVPELGTILDALET